MLVWTILDRLDRSGQFWICNLQYRLILLNGHED